MSRAFYYLKSPFLLAAAVCAVLFYAGIVPVRKSAPYESAVPVQDMLKVSGTVCSNPSKSGAGDYYSVKLRLSDVESSDDVARIKSSASGVIQISVPASIVEAVYPGKLYSVSDGVMLVENGERLSCGGFWSEKRNAFVVQDAVYEGYSDSVLHFRALSRLVFKRLMFSWGKAGGLVLSLLSGSREYLDDGIGDDFRNAGLSHILALSGMHLSFFSSFAGGIGKKFGRKAVHFFELSGILFFVWFAGLSPSLFRALLCSLISLVSKMFFCKKTDTLEILSCSFLVHVIFLPEDILSVAFMLSYGALAGILVFSDFLNMLISPLLPPKLSSPLSASASAQIATCPVSAAFFGAFMPVGIISSVFVSPAASIFIVFSLIFMISCFVFPFLSPFFGSIMNVFYNGMTGVVSMFAKIPPIKIY